MTEQTKTHAMTETAEDTTIWWGLFTMEEGEGGCWEIGPSRLWIHRLAREWRLVHTQEPDALAGGVRLRVPLPPAEAREALEGAPPGAAHLRFSAAQTEARIRLWPELADRPVVVRPETPLYVLDGEDVTLYVSTPLWIRFEGSDGERFLHERPTFRPSDTWFGASTREGELCYATRTAGRLRLEDLPQRSYRALTPILLRNRAEDPWLVERIQLPVAYLALYHDGAGGLWTPAVTLEREAGGYLAGLHVENGAPADARTATLLRPPRLTSRTSLIGRTFSTLFSKIREV